MARVQAGLRYWLGPHGSDKKVVAGMQRRLSAENGDAYSVWSKGYVASGWSQIGTVAATASHAIHLKVGHVDDPTL